MNTQNIYVSLAERLNLAKSRLLPQIFEELVAHQEARLLLALPATPEELANTFRLDENRTREMLDELMVKGLAIPLIKEGVSRYFLVRSALQLHDSCLHMMQVRRFWGCGSSFGKANGTRYVRRGGKCLCLPCESFPCPVP